VVISCVQRRFAGLLRRVELHATVAPKAPRAGHPLVAQSRT
jgi:hypothetical protein